jgi:hypothetical protein
MSDELMTEPAYVKQLTDALRQKMNGCQIDYERIRRDRYRFVVVWDAFENMEHPERQKLVWDIAGNLFTKAELWNIGMIITLAPSELTPDEEEELA